MIARALVILVVSSASISAADAPAVKVDRKGDVVRFLVGDREVLTYQGEKSALPAGYDPAYQRGGYIHPVRTPSGVVISDDYPPQHKHHHGIWSPWTKTSFEGRDPDFWNMGQKKGLVEFVAIDEVKESNGSASVRARHRMVDLMAKPQPKPAINETWDLRVHPTAGGDKPYNLFDLTITQTCASESPLQLPKYHYGGLGFRGHKQWDGKKNQFLTSEGKNRDNGNETRGKWVHAFGLIDGKMAGIAILDHPSNFRHPQPLRLHPAEPFVCYAPSQLGDWSIEPGKPYIARYRFIVHDGEMDRGSIEKLWAEFATEK